MQTEVHYESHITLRTHLWMDPIRKEPNSSLAEAGKEGRIDEEEDETKRVSNDMPSWYRTLALFGDSSVALFLSFILFLFSLSVALYLGHEASSSRSSVEHSEEISETRKIEEAYQKLGPVPTWIETSASVLEWKEDDPHFLMNLKHMFDRDGVVALRGLLSEKLLDQLDMASSSLIQEQFEKEKLKPKGALTGRTPEVGGKQFFTVKENVIFWALNASRQVKDVVHDNTEDYPDLAFLHVALQSQIPRIVSQNLLQLPTNETLRMMRDIFLAKDTDEYVCGWHVDDTGFWPADADAPGVNAWIALDDMPVQGGGGFALAVGSHTADWRYDAYQVTGSTHTFPPEGFSSARDTVERRVGNGTCNIASSAPHLHRRMEETKRMYEMKRGDIIFHNRWLFHRTVPFERTVVAGRQQSQPPLLYRRYSIRYGPGSSRIPRGYGTELSVLWDKQNAGRTVDQVAQNDAPWYPQAWPTPIDEEMAKLEQITTDRLDKVVKMADRRRQQLRRARRARHHIQNQPH